MDMSFQLRSQRALEDRRPARVDFSLLAAALAVQQAASAAAQAQARAVRAPAAVGLSDPLTELLLAGPEWRRAAAAQQGCFNRAEARRRLNVP